MEQYGAFEAKTHFSELLAAVIRGEKFIISKHGTKVAMIIPFVQDEEVSPARGAIRAIKKLRKGLTLGKKLSIKKMREEGRK